MPSVPCWPKLALPALSTASVSRCFFGTVLSPAVIARGEAQPSTKTVFVKSADGIAQQAMNLPVSPLRLVTLVIGAVPRKARPALPRCGGGDMV